MTIEFDGVFIKNITLYGGRDNIGRSDKIIIEHIRIGGTTQTLNYPFQFGRFGSTTINIDHYFTDAVSRIKVYNTTEIPFILAYKSIII